MAKKTRTRVRNRRAGRSRIFVTFVSGIAAVAAAAAGFRELPTLGQLMATTLAAATMASIAWRNSPASETLAVKKKDHQIAIGLAEDFESDSPERIKSRPQPVVSVG